MSAEDQAALVGVYRGELPNQTVSVLAEDDGLRLVVGQSYTLRPLGEYRFEVMEAGATVAFHVPNDGSAIVVEGEGLGRLERIGEPWEPSPDELEAFVGTYHSGELDTEYRLALEDGGLWVHHRKLNPDNSSPALKMDSRSGGRWPSSPERRRVR